MFLEPKRVLPTSQSDRDRLMDLNRRFLLDAGVLLRRSAAARKHLAASFPQVLVAISEHGQVSPLVTFDEYE